ncbi:MAG: diaminopimelate decarboxylase [Rhodocyclaceae bacterium]|nr:diaminopimelate decarboxylase [Rhodocyclaceae bacterium]
MTFPIPTLRREHGHLMLEDCPLADIAEQFGTPTYIYSAAAMKANFGAYTQALSGIDAMVCYAVKANSNLAVLSLFAGLGAGFDIVSGGELSRVLAAGGSADRVVFSGVGKRRDEIVQALEAGIRCFNIESVAELETVSQLASGLGRIAPVAFRVNPDVDARTHPYISTGLRSNKFGVPIDDAFDLYRRAAELPALELSGIACHIGSQLLDPAPVAEAADRVLSLVDRLADAGIALDHIDLGGGLGIRYQDESPPAIDDFLAPLVARMQGRRETLYLEPGRSLVGNAGLLLTRVELLKQGEEKSFAVVDAAMNDLARPALYDAYHQIEAVVENDLAARQYDVVGPICESGDFLARSRMLAIRPGDLVAVLSAGAYGMTMSSNYNSRPRAAEVLVRGHEAFPARQRESVEDLMRGERPLPAA